MDAKRWQELQKLFDAAHSAEPAERERILADADPELAEHARHLLAADQRRGPLDTLSTKLTSVAQLLREEQPTRIGPYRVVGELGRGGMGVVYDAQRADGQFEQRVAIKLVGAARTDAAMQQRFLAERQILASLTHPNIARLLDGGITQDGRPYLVLEHVDGLPITTYCEQHQLSLRERLRLFLDVCAAVQHAHRNLVIHRDIKPSNILVSRDGRVHLLDFGIAKLIERAPEAAPITRADLRAFTPEYASPEQLRGESLTTASDVYSLGVLLYELVAGSPPFDLNTESPLEAARIVCEVDPDRPSRRAPTRHLDGDVDSIVLMAMRKEPERRYASVSALRDDIERFLQGAAVAAHEDSWRYRLEKFVRRHRVEVAAAAIVTVSLIAGLTTALTQAQRAGRERDRAEQALAQSESVTEFLMELFRTGDADGTELPADVSALDLLKRGDTRINELSDQPMVQAQLLDVIGRLSLNLGRLPDAQRLLERAVQLRRTTPGVTSSDLSSSLIHLSWVHRSRAHLDTARTLAREALELRQRTLPPDDPLIADALYELGWVSFGTDQQRLYREAFAILERTNAQPERRVQLLQALSTNLRRQGNLADALAAGRLGLQTARRTLGEEHPQTGYAMIHVADHVRDIEGDDQEAEQLMRRGLELMAERYGDNSIRLLHGLNSLGTLLGNRGDNRAEQVLRRALAIRMEATGHEHPGVADQLQILARELNRQGRYDEAERMVREAIGITERTLGADHPAIMNARMPLLAEIQNGRGQRAQAIRTYESALAKMYPTGIGIGQARRGYGQMLLRNGDYANAEKQLVESLKQLESGYARRDHPNIQETRRALMELYLRWQKPELVERYRVPPGRFVSY